MNNLYLMAILTRNEINDFNSCIGLYVEMMYMLKSVQYITFFSVGILCLLLFWRFIFNCGIDGMEKDWYCLKLVKNVKVVCKKYLNNKSNLIQKGEDH